MNYFGAVLILFIYASSVRAKNATADYEKMMAECLPIIANEHDPLRCREGSGEDYEFDYDCCAGSDRSGSPGRCANEFQRTETTKACGQDHDWCRKNDCREYTCEQSTSCVKYVGCYKDKVNARDLPFKASKMDYKDLEPSDPRYFLLANISACANICRSKNFSYAGLQGAGECFCGDSYGKYGRTDERFCDKPKEKAVALRCGDGDAHTCVGVNAVYRLAGTERCCDYPQPPDHPHDIGAVIAFIVFSTVMTICCVATCLVLPMCIGGIVYAVYRSKRKKRLQQQQRDAQQERDDSVAIIQPMTASQPIQPVSVTVMDPAAQKAAAAAPTVVVAEPMPVVAPAVVVQAQAAL